MRTNPSLLARLFLLVALALLPAIGLLVATEVELREQRTQAARDQVLRLARDGAARLGRFVVGLREALVVLSEAPPVRAMDPAACTEMLLQLRQRFSDQVLLGAVAPDGWLLCTTLGTPPRTIYDGDRSFFRLAMERGEVVVSEWEPTASVLRGGTIHFGVPVRGAAGEPPRGVVGAAVGAGFVAELLRMVGLPPGAELTVVDRADQVVLHLSERPGPGLTIGRRAPDALLAVLPPFPPVNEEGAAGTVRDGPGPDGVARIFGIAPDIPGTAGALRLVVALDAGVAMAPVEAATKRGLLLIGAGMVLALLAAWLGARRFVLRPLAALLRVAERWRGGDYAARAVPALHGSVPELARLALTLDRIAMAAGERDRAAAALSENEARLSFALEAGGLAAWELDRASGAIVRSTRHDLLFGYAVPQRDWSWRRFLRHVLLEDRAMVREAFRSQRAADRPVAIEFRIRRAGDAEIRWLEARGAPHRGLHGAEKLLGVVADVTERRLVEARLRLTVGELNHRVKNTLAAVQSIAAQTLRGTEGTEGPIPASARRAFVSRLLALARSHEVLTREGWTGADLEELVGLALAPHGPAARAVIEGPPLRVSPRQAVPLGVALHELATNAARHGALSVPEGRVTVRWRLEPSGVLHLTWREEGGPAVRAPSGRGFGTRLLEGGLGRELGGTVRLIFRAEGVICEIRAPLRPDMPAAAAA